MSEQVEWTGSSGKTYTFVVVPWPAPLDLGVVDGNYICARQTIDGGWIPVHMTINRVELEPGTFAALLALRLPTDAELELVDFSDDHDQDAPGQKKPRKDKKRKKNKGKKDDGD